MSSAIDQIPTSVPELAAFLVYRILDEDVEPSWFVQTHPKLPELSPMCRKILAAQLLNSLYDPANEDSLDQVFNDVFELIHDMYESPPPQDREEDSGPEWKREDPPN